MAEVHLGHDTRLGRPVAIKMLRSDLARDPTFLARFRREAQSAAGLNHASIVAVYDSGEDHATETGGARSRCPTSSWSTSRGGPCASVLNERSPLDPAEAARITEGVLDALAYSHRMGIVHRDIKPANVMIAAAGRDQGHGLRHRPGDGRRQRHDDPDPGGHRHRAVPLARAGAGPPGRRPLRPLLHGLPALRAAHRPAAVPGRLARSPSPTSTSASRRRGRRAQPRRRPRLDAVVLHALAKDREARYQDATAFRADLQAARLGRPISDAARGTAAARG